MISSSTTYATSDLSYILALMDELVTWLIRSGVNYSEFSAALKPIFYEKSVQELERIKQKKTVSSISLLSGLHRKDVTAFKTAEQQGQPLTQAEIAEPVSVPSRVITLWIVKELPQKLPFSSKDNMSFEQLVRQISTERHPRSVLNELERLSIVQESDGHVILNQYSFTPDSQASDARKILVKNVKSHLQAGVHNIFSEPPQHAFLEQAIRADGLSDESIKILRETSIKLWNELALELLSLATQRCHLDAQKSEANKEFSFGVYQYDNQSK